ncbi:MAG: ABC transporter permease [Defluviitaleaceae bacterium]|nr:ABC transporter permease [Defluviitaleaceae bacterium]MCL2835708.1 ABC transporter permease [Defluviitaleaceae bacterium]
MDKLLKRMFAPNEKSGFLPSLIAIAIGLVAGFIFLLISRPGQAVGAFLTILTSGFGDIRAVGEVLYHATPILMTGLSFSFANKTGLFNIGAAGQFICGAYAAVLVGVKCSFLPGHLHWITALAAAMLAGALWGAIPGFLKAFYNVNEVISCIMMNYIGMYLVNYLIVQTVFDSRYNQSMRVEASAVIPRMGLDQIFRVGPRISSVNGGIIIAIVIAVLLYILLEKTSFGYELKACGLNRDAAKYAGVNEKRSIVVSMIIAGAAAGIGGALVYLAGAGNRIDVVDVLAAEGFNGIPVALLAMSNPLGVIFSAIFVAYLNVGGFFMQRFDFAPQIIEIIVAIIIYFSAFALVFRNLLRSMPNKFRKKKENQTEGGGGQ